MCVDTALPATIVKPSILNILRTWDKHVILKNDVNTNVNPPKEILQLHSFHAKKLKHFARLATPLE